MSQRSVAGGLTTTRLPSRNTTASSRTTSVTTHSPEPFRFDTDGAIASSSVNRTRQADGASSTCEVGSMAGRGRGNGTLWAAAGSIPAAHSIISGKRNFIGPSWDGLRRYGDDCSALFVSLV